MLKKVFESEKIDLIKGKMKEKIAMKRREGGLKTEDWSGDNHSECLSGGEGRRNKDA